MTNIFNRCLMVLWCLSRVADIHDLNQRKFYNSVWLPQNSFVCLSIGRYLTPLICSKCRYQKLKMGGSSAGGHPPPRLIFFFFTYFFKLFSILTFKKSFTCKISPAFGGFASWTHWGIQGSPQTPFYCLTPSQIPGSATVHLLKRHEQK
jgi:hypothetical protein